MMQDQLLGGFLCDWRSEDACGAHLSHAFLHTVHISDLSIRRYLQSERIASVTLRFKKCTVELPYVASGSIKDILRFPDGLVIVTNN